MVGAPSDIVTVKGETLEMTTDVMMDVYRPAEDADAERETEDVECVFTTWLHVTALDCDELPTSNNELRNFSRLPSESV